MIGLADTAEPAAAPAPNALRLETYAPCFCGADCPHATPEEPCWGTTRSLRRFLHACEGHRAVALNVGGYRLPTHLFTTVR